MSSLPFHRREPRAAGVALAVRTAWMLALCLGAVTGALAQPTDVAGARDPLGLERVPFSWIVSYELDPDLRQREFVVSRVDKTRREVRELIDGLGGFIEVHVATSVEVCEQRDRKGLYAKARAGIIKGFTGIDDPYEAPEHAEVVIDTGELSAEEAAQHIIMTLQKEGFLQAPETEAATS